VGRVRHPVGEQHGLVLREVAVVEHEQKLTTIGIQALNGMWDSRGKIPQIAFRHVTHKALAIGIEPRDARIPVKHEGPLGSRVPVQLSYASGGQSHVHAGNRFGNRELPDRHLTRPSAFLHPFMRDSKRIFKRLHAACVGGRWQEGIGILFIQRRIAGTGSAGASVVLCRIRFLILGCGIRR
jgi:hypothetical protein